MSKKLSLAERWDLDDKSPKGANLYRCHKCKHRGDSLKCTVYGTIPKDIADGSKTCDEYIKGKLDMGKITL